VTFQNPAGLWLLFGIPLLVLLYLLHSRREKRLVSSTYVWKLSERFLKRKTKLSRWHKLLLLLVQMLAVLTLSLAIAKPALAVGVAKDYILLFDTSVSMRTQNEEGVTRLDEAKAKAKELLAEVSKGNRITVILLGEEATVLANRSSDEGMIELALQHLRCGEGSASEDEGFALAKSIAEQCQNPAVIYYTDRPSQDKLYRPFFTVVDCSVRAEKWNLSLYDMAATKAEDGLAFSASLLTSQSGTFTVALAVDGRTLDALTLTAEATRPQTVTFAYPSQTYGYAEIYVQAEDGNVEDNRVAITYPHQTRRQALLVSQYPLFIETVLGVMQGWDVVVTTSPTDSHLAPHSGYDLYIFDSITPPEYPTDGSVLTVNTDELPGGVLLGDEVHEEAGILPSHSSPFTENITLENVALSTYRPLLANATWDILLTCHDEPVMISRQMAEGVRYTCISFDLHHSNLPANYNYFPLLSAVISASAPKTVDSHLYLVGEKVTFSKLPRSIGVEVLYPSGIKRQLSFENGVSRQVFHQAGVYTVLQHFEGGITEKTYFCMEISADEWASAPVSGLPDILPAEADEGQKATSDISLYLVVAALLLLILEWGVYYREKC